MVGSAGEAVFFAIFLALGCAWLVWGFVSIIIPQWRVNHEFKEHRCTVVEKLPSKIESAGGGKLYQVRVKYQVNGVDRQQLVCDLRRVPADMREEPAATWERFEINREYQCWYDPAHPDMVVLERGYSDWIWLNLIVPASFVIIGGGGLLYSILHWGKSAESRAARVRHTRGELLGGDAPSTPLLPSVPDCGEITSSPGTRLAYRLPLASSPAWALFGLLLACLLWNGIVAVLVASAVSGHLAGKPDWLLTLFIIPFLLVGVAFIVLFVRQMWLTTGVGPTLLEISDHPLLPGGQYRVFVSQSGHVKIRACISCWRAKRKPFTGKGRTRGPKRARSTGSNWPGARKPPANRSMPLEGEWTLDVPTTAMHSFRADHNAVHWKLVVQADASRRAFQRSFAIVVYPRPADESSQRQPGVEPGNGRPCAGGSQA